MAWFNQRICQWSRYYFPFTYLHQSKHFFCFYQKPQINPAQRSIQKFHSNGIKWQTSHAKIPPDAIFPFPRCRRAPASWIPATSAAAAATSSSRRACRPRRPATRRPPQQRRRRPPPRPRHRQQQQQPARRPWTCRPLTSPCTRTSRRRPTSSSWGRAASTWWRSAARTAGSRAPPIAPRSAAFSRATTSPPPSMSCYCSFAWIGADSPYFFLLSWLELLRVGLDIGLLQSFATRWKRKLGLMKILSAFRVLVFLTK